MKYVTRLVAALALPWFMLLASSCSQRNPEPVATGRGLTSFVMIAQGAAAMTAPGDVAAPPGGYAMSSALYAEVNSRWLAGFMERYRADLHQKGVPVSVVPGSARSGWDPSFNCTMFAELYVADAGAELLAQMSYSHDAVGWPPFSRPAIFTVWYTPDDAPIDPTSKQRAQHCVVLVITESGARFVDPQSQATPTGEVTLSASEKRSISHRQA